jgi:hypothetical protein
MARAWEVSEATTAPPETCLSKLPPIIVKGGWMDMAVIYIAVRYIVAWPILSLERIKQGIHKVLKC